MLVWTIILIGITGGQDDVTKLPVDDRIAYADKLANRFEGPNAWDDYKAAIAAFVPVYKLFPNDLSSVRGKHLFRLDTNLDELGESRHWTPAWAAAIAEYLNANTKSLRLLAKASEKKRCFIPLVAAGNRLHQSATDFKATHECRALARLMILKSNDCALKGEWGKAFQWNVRIHRMADHLYQQMFSIQHLVPLSIKRLANRHTMVLFSRQFPTDWRSVIEDTMSLDERHCPVDTTEVADALWMWDYLESWHEWAQDQSRHPDLTSVAKMFVTNGAEHAGNEVLNNALGELLGQSSFQSIEAIQSAIKHVTLEQEWLISRKLDQISARWRSQDFHISWKLVEEFEREYCELMTTSPTLSIGGCGQMQTSHFDLMFKLAEVQMDGVSIVGSVLAFQRDRRELPRELGELVPKFLDQIATDPFSGSPFIYRVTNGGSNFKVYSVGPDQIDNDGKRSVKLRDTGDCIIWPLRITPVDSID